MSTATSLIIAIIAAILGIVIGFFLRKSMAEKKIRSAEDYAVKIIEDANKDAETKKKELLVEAKDEIFKMKSDLDRENKSRLKEISRQEDRLNSKEENLERKNASLEKKHKKLDSELKKADDMQQKIQSIIDEKELELEKVMKLRTLFLIELNLKQYVSKLLLLKKSNPKLRKNLKNLQEKSLVHQFKDMPQIK